VQRYLHPFQKEIANQVKSFYRVLSGSLEQSLQPFLNRIGYTFEHHFTRHFPKADLYTVPYVRVISDGHPNNILHTGVLEERNTLDIMWE
jgi:hypothetical protein